MLEALQGQETFDLVAVGNAARAGTLDVDALVALARAAEGVQHAVAEIAELVGGHPGWASAGP